MIKGKQISILGEGNLSEHLTKAEVRAASHKGVKTINSLLPPLFELVREFTGSLPVSVNSAGRIRDVSGSVSDSDHKHNDALDLGLSPSRMSTLKAYVKPFLKEAIPLGLKGFGVYHWGVHIDVGKEPTNTWYAPDGTGFKIRHWSKDNTPLFLTLFGENPVHQDTDFPVDAKKQGFPWYIFAISVTAGFSYWLYSKYFKK